MENFSTTQLRHYLGFLIMLVFWLFLMGCTKDEIPGEFVYRTLTINETTVSIDDFTMEIVDGEARSENYTVLFYDGIIHVFSLKEFYIKTVDSNKAYAPLEDGSMYFTFQDIYDEYPVTVRFLVARQ